MKNIKNIFANILKKLRKITSKFLSVLKENKNISVSILVLILLVSVGIIITYSYFRLSSENNIFTGSADYYANPDLNIKYMIENRNAEGSGDGSYTAYWSAPVAGYTYNAEKSNCSNGATFTRNEADETFDIYSKGKTECEFFYEANDDAVVADTILEIYKENKTTGEYELAYDYKLETLLNGGYEFNDTLSTCSSGSIALDAVSKKIVMTSTSVNNCKAYFDLGTSEYNYTGDYQTFTALESGTYKFETWGASGSGTYECNSKGAYNAGEIYLEKGETFYIYIGEYGDKIISAYNGGGAAYTSVAGSGGGATDIRLISGDWDTAAGLNSRIMVSGAGGGGSKNYSIYDPDHAGGLIGDTGYATSYTAYTASGGTQTSGGVVNNYNSSYSAGTNGIFGIGGNGGGSGSNGSSSGGGGYYGGAGGSRLLSGSWPAGGGSSYISGHTGSVAITNETDRSPRGIDFKVRYIEAGSNGSTSNTGNFYVELAAYNLNGNNIAYGKTVTTTGVESDTQPLSRITDSSTLTTPYASIGSGKVSITVDLGAEYILSGINLWRYYGDGRTFYETYLKVYNADKTKWAYLHNYEIDGTYAESSTPKTVYLNCTTGTTDKLCSHHYSGYIFDNTIMIDGEGYNWTNEKGSQVAMPSPSGGTYALGIGHSGHGYAKITYMGE